MKKSACERIIIMTSPASSALESLVYGRPSQREERYDRKNPIPPLHDEDGYEDTSADKIAKKNRVNLFTNLIQNNDSTFFTQDALRNRDGGNVQFPSSFSIADNVPWMLMQARITTETNSLKNTAKASERATKTIELIDKASQAALADIIRKENECASMSFWSRLFKFVTGVVQLVSAAIVLATVGITGIGVVAAAYLLVQGANDLWNAASGQQENWIAAGISKIAQAFGASKELADKIGLGVSLALSLVMVVATFGTSAGGVASIASNTTAMSRMLISSFKTIQSAGSFTSAVGQGITGITTAFIVKDVTYLEAHVVELKAEIDFLQKFQKILTKNSLSQMSSFEATMQNLTDFLLSRTNTNKKFIENMA